MNEFVYKDYTPSNARIVVNYRKGEKVKFSYPIDWTYRRAVIHRALPTILQFWLMLHLTIFMFMSIYVFMPASIGALLALINNGVLLDFSLSKTMTMNFPINKFLLFTILCYGYLFLSPFILTGILALNKERLSKWMPKLGYYSAVMSGRIKTKTFTKDDVKDKKVIIHSFSNVYLYYNADEEFEKYLDKVEILETPFEYSRKSIIFPFIKAKKEKNDFDFRAVFYFSDTPSKGSLQTKFR